MKILGIDIGGTNIKYMLKDGESIVEAKEVPSRAKEGAEKLLEVVFKICDEHNFDAIGVSTAGMVGKNGEILYANENIPHYTGVKLREMLEKKYHVKVKVLNDIYASSLSELSKERNTYYFIAIGTGIGGAYIESGKILKGHKYFGGQIGYLPSKDGTNIIDKTASVTGLKALTNISPRVIFHEIEKGNKEAEKAMSKWCQELVYLITMVVGFFNPKFIVLGGGVTSQGQKLIDAIKKEFYLLPEPYQNSFELLIAKEDNWSGAVGAIKNIENEYE